MSYFPRKPKSGWSDASAVNNHPPFGRDYRSGVLSCCDHTGEDRRRKSEAAYWGCAFSCCFQCSYSQDLQGRDIGCVVHKIMKHGVFLRCAPVEDLYLSTVKMPDYRYVPGENPYFLNDKMSKIGKDVVVRCVVVGTKWMEADRKFQALVSLERDYLGPISSPEI